MQLDLQLVGLGDAVMTAVQAARQRAEEKALEFVIDIPADLPRVAEPFFSTKISGEGLGLGLSISQAIIAEFGGEMSITSAPGKGTGVTLSLPTPQQQEGAAA